MSMTLNETAASDRRPTLTGVRLLRDAIVSLSVLALAMALQSVATYLAYADGAGLLATLVPAIATLLVLAAIFIVQQDKPSAGIGLALSALAVSLLFATIQFADVGLLAAIIYALVAAVLVANALPPRHRTVALGAALLVALVMLLLELLWPWDRRLVLQGQLAILMWLSMVVPLLTVALNLRHFRRYTLETKLITAFLLVALLPLAILVLVNNLSTRQALIDNANERLLAAARQTAVTLDDFFDGQLNAIRNEASVLQETGYFEMDPEQRIGSQAESESIALLKTYRDKNPLNISSYAVLDPTGNVILEYPLLGQRVPEGERPYFTVPLNSGQPHASEVEFTPVVGGPFLYFSTPIRDSADNIVGVLRARYKASILQQIIARSTGLVGGQSFAVLFDENNLHLAHGSAPDEILTLVDELPADEVAALQADLRLPNLPPEGFTGDLDDLAQNLNAQRAPDAPADRVFVATDVATGERLDQIAVTEMQSQPWLVAFFQPQDVFLQPAENQTQTAIVLAILVSAGVAALAVALSRLLTDPIARLEAAAGRIAQGNLSVRAEVVSEDEIGELARTFNLMADQLQATLAGLEQRVADRTQALATSTEVGRRLSTILDQDTLVREVVDQVQRAFNYYHAHIYLYDASGEWLNMVGGTGQAGQTMLESGHRIARGRGLVGRAAQQNAVVLVPDVAKDPDWLPNPLLPETRSEVAVPISIGDQVLGVLDVQDDEVNGLQQQDADLLLSIANQVAIALQNAGSVQQLQRQAQHRARINEINRKIQSAPDVDSAMQIAVRELGRAVGARYTRVWLGEADGASNGAPSDREE
ncbi:MAG: GAF domain-containing protein [Candidatus Promineifilaceae bacterium]|nr:GAF domain-containing protein [Candidatus Promineifilaceae bacterium]